MPRDDRIEQPRVAERLVAHHQEVDVLLRHVVIEGQVRRVVGLAVLRELVLERIALRPRADRILAVDDELDRLVERRLVFRIALLDDRAAGEASPTPPCPHRRTWRCPSSAGTLRAASRSCRWCRTTRGASGRRRSRPCSSSRRTACCAQISALATFSAACVVILVAGRVIGVQEQMAHRRRARRLDPDHRVASLPSRPSAANRSGKIRPHVAAVGADAFDHEGRGALHGVEDLWRDPARRRASLSADWTRARLPRCAAGHRRPVHDHAASAAVTCPVEHKAPARTAGARRRADRRRLSSHRSKTIVARRVRSKTGHCGSALSLGSPVRANASHISLMQAASV